MWNQSVVVTVVIFGPCNSFVIRHVAKKNHVRATPFDVLGLTQTSNWSCRLDVEPRVCAALIRAVCSINPLSHRNVE